MDAPISNEEKERLVAGAVEGGLDPVETGRLVALCRRDPEVLAQLIEQTLTHRLLSPALRDPDGETWMREVCLRVGQSEGEGEHFAQQVTSKLKRRRTVHWLQIAAGLMLLAVGGWWLWPQSEAAVILRAESLAGSDLAPGNALHNGQRVHLEGGVLALRFGCGAEVIVEGPADLVLRNRWQANLLRGRVVSRVPEEARGFTIDGPRGRLVDLGTEFAVAVGEEGEMEVHVLQGIVEATPNGQKAPMRLVKNEALRLGAGSSARLTADPGAFITALPPRTGSAPGFIHWNFEGDGEQVGNVGLGLGGPEAGLTLKNAREDGPWPSRTAGRFGQGIFFDGEGAYAESGYRGIGGTAARTVAFWVQVPKDFDARHGYGIVSWGSYVEPGAAWQISINPVAGEGPVGHLRVGINRGPVIGASDLRDGLWHHCAVVMYGGNQPDLSTHILLYLDGRLEPAARKSVLGINTDIEHDAKGVWMGRNRGGAVRGFRGAVDEVFIFDCALDQGQIRELYLRNQAPGI